ncbi:MAG TPA: tetratricopeptide repeat protein [candidate division Zixibacteria bacterium]|nr:tetratricopeptide repeat protein [candidate division Zixibacteria bacterium]
MSLFRFRTLAVALIAAALVGGGCANYNRTVVVKEDSQPEAKNHGMVVAAEKHFNTGMKFFHKGQYKQAVKHFEKAIEKNHRHWEAHYYLGVAHREMRDYRVAQHRLELALQNAPSDDKKVKARIYVALGITWESAGDPSKAQTNFALAVELDSDNREAHDGLSRVKGPKGKGKSKGQGHHKG